MKLSSVLFATCALLPLSVYPAFAAGSDQAQDKRAAQYRAVQHAMDMVNMPTIGPLFLQDSTFSTKLTIVNAGLAPVTGFVTLRSLDGTTIIQQPVPVKGNSSVILEIGEMLSKAGSLSTRGRLELYDRTTEGSALAGQLTISYTDKGRVHAIDEELMMPSMTTSHALRGIAIDTTDEPYYAITNPLTESETVTAKCYPEKGAAEQGTFNLQAQETVLVQGCHRLDDSSNLSSLAPNTKEPSTLGAFAIELIADAPKGEVQAFGIAPRPSPGGSEWTAINFFDPQKFEAATTIYTGVPLGRTPLLWGTYTPHVALHNFADKAQNVTVQLDATAGDTATRTVVGSVTMQPGESRSLDIADAVGSSELLNTLIVTGSEISGGIASQLMVEDRSQDLRMQIIGKSGADDTNIGMHPWTIVDGTSNELLLYNQTTKAQKAYVKIANGEKSWLKTMTLGPGTTIRISLAHLIQGHAKDDKGVILTAGQGYGEFSWSADDQGRIKGRLLHLNEDKHTIESFQCAGYQTLCDGSVTGTTNLIVGQQGSWSANFPACINNLAPNLCGGVVSGSANIASYSWFAGNIQLPADTNSALISGYATAAGNDTVTANATALGGCVVSASANVSISQFSVTFSPSSLSVGVGTAGSLTATVNPSNNTNPITLSLVPSGSGAAVFAANGSSTITITGTRTLSITGSSLTSSGSPIALKATVPGETSPIEIDQGRASITVGYPPAVVTNISPSVWTAGTTFSVTISGSNFGTSPPTVSIASGAGVTISAPSNSSPTQFTATVSVAANAPNETVTISVQPNYGGSNFTCNCQGQSPNGTDTATVQQNLPAPTIHLNGITNNVFAGQLIPLSVTAPSGFNLASQTWSFRQSSGIGGIQDITGGFTNSAGNGPPSAAAGGEEAQDPDVTQTSIQFYFLNPGTVENVTATVTYKLADNSVSAPVSATQSFTIQGPTGTILPTAFVQTDDTATSVANAQGNPAQLRMTNAPGKPAAGIWFSDTATQSSGRFIWVQILNSVTYSQVVQTGVPYSPPANALNQLDGVYPYPNDDIISSTAEDSPGRPLDSVLGEGAESFDATMYVLWDPALPAGCTPAKTDDSTAPYTSTVSHCTSIPVPLASVRWKWTPCAINSLAPAPSSGTIPSWFRKCGPGLANPAQASGYPTWNSCYVSKNAICQQSN